MFWAILAKLSGPSPNASPASLPLSPPPAETCPSIPIIPPYAYGVLGMSCTLSTYHLATPPLLEGSFTSRTPSTIRPLFDLHHSPKDAASIFELDALLPMEDAAARTAEF